MELQKNLRQFHAKLKDFVRRKLEDVVLETMDHPSQVPEEFKEYKQIAKENGFTELIEDGFEKIEAEIGRIQIERALHRRQSGRIQEEEKKLQAYFIADDGKRLEKIEQGLKYVAHEKPTRAGRLDILAEDTQKKEVKIELKARDYNSRYVFMQIMKYFNDDKSGNARLVFIAPEVKSDLLISLAQYEKTGRMAFFRVDRTNGDYSLTKVKPEDVPEPKPINWAKRKRGEKTGLMTVAGELPQERGIPERDESKKKTEDEWRAKWNKLSVFDKYMLTYLPKSKPSSRTISAEEFSHLMKRVLSAQQIIGLQIDEPEMKQVIHNVKVSNLAAQGYELYEKYGMKELTACTTVIGAFAKLTSSGYENTGENLEERLTMMKNASKNLVTFEMELNKMRGDKRFKRLVKELEMSSPIDLEEILQTNLLRRKRLQVLSDVIRTKVDRTRALQKVAPELASIYLKYGVSEFVTLMTDRDFIKDGEINFYESDLGNYAATDNLIYKALITRYLSIDGVELEKGAFHKNDDAINHVQQTKLTKPEERQPAKYDIDAVIPLKVFSSGHLSNDTEETVRIFVDEVLNNPSYSEMMKAGLAEEARKNKWYKNDLKEIEVRTFFDDLTITAARSIQ